MIANKLSSYRAALVSLMVHCETVLLMVHCGRTRLRAWGLLVSKNSVINFFTLFNKVKKLITEFSRDANAAPCVWACTEDGLHGAAY